MTATDVYSTDKPDFSMNRVREERLLSKNLELNNKHHGLDNDNQVFFYEQEFYVLSNFSAFAIEYKELIFPTLEHAYHWEKFPDAPTIQYYILNARSAHVAFQNAQENKHLRRKDWDSVKVNIMLDLLREKVKQHEYVKRKLLQTGNRTLVENSWRDDYWGWGPNKDGQNMLGKCWMQIRDELYQVKDTNSLKLQERMTLTRK